MTVAFGLGSTTNIQSLEIRWPSGTVQTISSLGADQKVTIVESTGNTDAPSLVLPPVGAFVLHSARPNPCREPPARAPRHS